jgi:hypothetical protein
LPDAISFGEADGVPVEGEEQEEIDITEDLSEYGVEEDVEFKASDFGEETEEPEE